MQAIIRTLSGSSVSPETEAEDGAAAPQPGGEEHKGEPPPDYDNIDKETEPAVVEGTPVVADDEAAAPDGAGAAPGPVEEAIVTVVEEDDDEEEEGGVKPGEEDDVMARAKAAGVVRHPAEAYRNPCQCPDALFALGWGLCFFIALVVCFEYGWTEVSEAEYDDDDDKKEDAVGNLAKILICQLLVAFGIAEVAALVTLRIGRYAIHSSLVFTEIIIIGTAAFAAQYAYWYTTLFLLIVALFVILYHANSLHSIDDASATLMIACTFLSKEGRALQALSFLGSFVATIMIFVCSLAVYGLFHYKSSKKNEDRQALALSMFLLICIWFWTSRVVKYVTVATVAGTMKWWWADETPETLPPVQKPAVVALFRTWMFNLGSIALGALLVDIFDVSMTCLRRSREWAERYPHGLCASCLVAACACACGACEGGCDVVNAYAFVFVGIHGYSFFSAGKHVITVFHKMGRKANDTEIFTDYVFFWQAVAIGMAACIFGLYMVKNGDPELSAGTRHAEVIVGFIGLFSGTAVASCVFALITGANKTTALLFSDTPRVLAVAHPDEFATLATVWQFGGAALGGPTYGSSMEP